MMTLPELAQYLEDLSKRGEPVGKDLAPQLLAAAAACWVLVTGKAKREACDGFNVADARRQTHTYTEWSDAIVKFDAAKMVLDAALARCKP